MERLDSEEDKRDALHSLLRRSLFSDVWNEMEVTTTDEIWLILERTGKQMVQENNGQQPVNGIGLDNLDYSLDWAYSPSRLG